MVLHLRYFGSFEALLDEQPLLHFPTTRALILLAYLGIVKRARRDHLAAILWPDKPQVKGRVSLRQCLRRLRQGLGRGSILIEADQQFIWVDQTRLITDCDAVEAEAAAWRQHGQEHQGAGSAYLCQTCQHHLETMQRGLSQRFLADFPLVESDLFRDWVTQEQARWDHHAQMITVQLGENLKRRRSYDQLLEIGRWSLRFDPWSEIAHQQIMHALWRLGDRSAALNHYARLKSDLQQEMGVDPNPHTRLLASEISDDQSLAQPASSPPLQHHPPLFGRADLLNQLRQQLLNAPPPQSIALHGLPGVGKTALLHALANDPAVRQTFGGQIFWVNLGVSPDLMALLAELGEQLRLSSRTLAHTTTPAARAALLHEALLDQKALLILDDAWQLHEALFFKIGGSRVRHLLATRHPELAVDFAAAAVLHAQELDQVDSVALLHHLVPATVDAYEEELTEVANKVGGLPLALLLIGKYLLKHAYHNQPGRLKRAIAHLQTAAGRLHLSQPQHPVHSHPHDPSAEEVSLRSTIALSFEALTPAESSLLYTLALFAPKPHSFSEESALAVSEVPPYLLDRLVHLGLLQPLGADQFAIHQTIADFALQTGTTDRTKNFLSYYDEFLQRHQLNFTQIQREYVHIRRALNFAGSYPPIFIRLLSGLYPYLDNWGLLDDWPALLAKGRALLTQKGGRLEGISDPEQAAAERDEIVALDAELTFREGQFLHRSLKTEAAEVVLIRARQLAQQAGKQRVEVGVLKTLGNLLIEKNRFDEGIACFDQGLTLSRALQEVNLEAALLNNLGTAYYLTSRYETARNQYEQALAIRQKSGHRQGTGFLLQNLGVIEVEQGRFSSGAAYYEQAIALYREFNQQRNLGQVLNNLGLVCKNMGQWPAAERHFAESLHIREALNDQAGQAMLNSNVAILLMQQGALDEAEKHIQDGLRLAQTYKFRLTEGRLLDNWARLYLLRESYGAALDHAATAVAIARTITHRQLEGFGLLRQAEALAGLDRSSEAGALFEVVQEVWRELDRPFLAIQTAAYALDLHLRAGPNVPAGWDKTLYGISSHLSSSLDGFDDPVRMLLICREGLHRLGQTDRAAAHLQQAADYFQRQIGLLDDQRRQTSFSNYPSHVRLRSLFEPLG